MGPDQRQSDAVDELRRLTASDPKKARAEFHELLKRGGEALNEVLTAATRPGEGRLRQMIAIAFRTDARATILEPWLRRWLEAESDEFTKTAIDAALTSRGGTAAARPITKGQAIQTIEAYRFVADRLCHRIRNAMALPNAQLRNLEYVIDGVADTELQSELREILAGIQSGFTRISRNVEFDTGDDYLQWQSISPLNWLHSMEKDFTARFGPANLVVTCESRVRRSTIRASRFFLETIFGNLWANAVQVADPPCRFEIECALDTRRGTLEMLVLDNGPGFPEKDLDTAFQQVFSTKSQSRGRGLLEIADAVKRLQGTATLKKRRLNEYRVHISLPVEAQ